MYCPGWDRTTDLRLNRASLLPLSYRTAPKVEPAFKDEAEYIACLSSAGGAGVDDTKGPTTVSIPLKVGDSFVVETDGPNLVSVAVERCTCSEAQTICPRCLRILRQSEP